MKKCAKCNEEIEDSVKFCPKCGASQENQESKSAVESNASSALDTGITVDSLLKFGKKIGKSASQAAGVGLASAQKKIDQKKAEENERIEFIKNFTFSQDPLEIQEQLPQILEVQKQLTVFSGVYKDMAQRKMEAAIQTLKKNKFKKEAKYWKKAIETPSQKLFRIIKIIIIIAVILLVICGISVGIYYYTIMKIKMGGEGAENIEQILQNVLE